MTREAVRHVLALYLTSFTKPAKFRDQWLDVVTASDFADEENDALAVLNDVIRPAGWVLAGIENMNRVLIAIAPNERKGQFICQPEFPYGPRLCRLLPVVP